MPITRQPNGNLLIQFQYLGERVHRSARTTSVREARELEEEPRRQILDGDGPLQGLRTAAALGLGVELAIVHGMA